MFSDFQTLVSCLDNPNVFALEYDRLLTEWLNQPLWCTEYPEVKRFHWRSAKQAREANPELFSQNGLILFGASRIPRYIGITIKNDFWKRLNNRFILDPYSQFDLAETYEAVLIREGFKGFPVEVVDWYRTNFKGRSRLDHAVDFARHGIFSVWFVLIPSNDKGQIKGLKKRMIAAGHAWNIRQGYKKLLNQR